MLAASATGEPAAKVPKVGSPRLVAASVALVFLAAGCTDTGSSTSSSESSPSRSWPPTKVGGCVQSPRSSTDSAIQGTTEIGELWALGGGPRVGEVFKIVVRATGSGELKTGAISPAGTRLVPDDVEAHLGSNFNRPGDEWGVFFSFDQPGCWRLEFERAELRGFITLRVHGA